MILVLFAILILVILEPKLFGQLGLVLLFLGVLWWVGSLIGDAWPETSRFIGGLFLCALFGTVLAFPFIRAGWRRYHHCP